MQSVRKERKNFIKMSNHRVTHIWLWRIFLGIWKDIPQDVIKLSNCYKDNLLLKFYIEILWDNLDKKLLSAIFHSRPPGITLFLIRYNLMKCSGRKERKNFINMSNHYVTHIWLWRIFLGIWKDIPQDMIKLSNCYECYLNSKLRFLRTIWTKVVVCHLSQ